MKKKKEYIEKEIDGRKVRIKIIKQPQGAWAHFDGKTIILNEKTIKTLDKNELNSILYHETGHFKFINQLLTWLPILAVLSILVYFFIKYCPTILEALFSNFPIIYTLFALILIIFCIFLVGMIIELPICWAKEILADWNAVKNTKGDIFRQSLKECYRYNKEVTKPSLKRFYNWVVMHPPQPIRLKILKYMERLRDKRIVARLRKK